MDPIEVASPGGQSNDLSTEGQIRLRRAFGIAIMPTEDVRFDLAELLTGRNSLATEQRWFALMPHRGVRQALAGAEVLALIEFSETDWITADDAARKIGSTILQRLLDLGLLVVDGSGDNAAERDETLRRSGWEPLSAIAHQLGRWSGVDTAAALRDGGFDGLNDVIRILGPAPPPTVDRGSPSDALPLPPPRRTAVDELLAHRVTCRNFDIAATLPLSVLADILHRVFAAQSSAEPLPGHRLLKKTSPSGGGLHPTEVHVLTQRVEGMPIGLHHYRPLDHALAPIRVMEADEAARFGSMAVAGQTHFSAAPVLFVLSCRFERSFWKYRNHSKALRAVLLDVGHLSQTLYISATECGLGAFITAAINEVELDEALGLDGLREGAVAVCGIGARTRQRVAVEFDPEQRIWHLETGQPNPCRN